MLPPPLIHEVIEFRRAVARVLRASDWDLLRALLAPRIPAPSQGTDYLRRRLVLFFVDEDGIAASDQSRELVQ